MTRTYDVTCENPRGRTVVVPVALTPVVVDGVDVTPMLACQDAEVQAASTFGGSVDDWVAWRVVPTLTFSLDDPHE